MTCIDDGSVALQQVGQTYGDGYVVSGRQCVLNVDLRKQSISLRYHSTCSEAVVGGIRKISDIAVK